MNGTLRRILILVGSLSLLSLPLAAAADEGNGNGDPADDPQLVYQYDSFVHVLIYGFDYADAEPPLDCTLPDGVTVELDPDGLVTVVGGDLPEGCSALNVEGPNGQVNHGTFVSAFVHALKAGFEGDMPFGRYVRQFAKSDLGKGDDHVQGADGEDDLETDAEDGPASTKAARGSKANNGNGHGRNGA